MQRLHLAVGSRRPTSGSHGRAESSTTRSHGGLGLGLAIVRYLVEAHGGTIIARSEGPGRGAQFVASLPISSSERDDSDSATSTPFASGEHLPIPAPTKNDLDGVRALVVDDDADSLELLRLLLERAGATVTSFTSATTALRQTDPFDVIISDIGMPEMDGHQLIQRFRAVQRWASVPAIALTAYARDEDSALALQAGYQEHLTKPVHAAALIARVKKWARSN